MDEAERREAELEATIAGRRRTLRPAGGFDRARLGRALRGATMAELEAMGVARAKRLGLSHPSEGVASVLEDLYELQDADGV